MVREERPKTAIAGGVPLAALALAVMGCFGSPTEPYTRVPGIPPEHEMIYETRALTGVRGVLLTIPAELTIEQGAAESLTIYTDKSFMPHTRSNVRGGVLELWTSVELGAHPIRIEFLLTVPGLESVEVVGGGEVQGSELDFDRLSLRSDGSQPMSFSTLHASVLEARVEDGGPILVAGGTTEQRIWVLGKGDYEGRYFASSEAEVRILGSGSATVRVRDRLSVEITGSGCVFYLGDPLVENTTPNHGCIERLAG